MKHIYQNPHADSSQLGQAAGQQQQQHVDQENAIEDYLVFFEDMYMEFSKFGRVEDLQIVENLGDHMIGHMYVKFADEEEASDALQVMNGRYYDGRKMEVEFSPVTDFREARCRDYDEDSCKRGGFCNFLHVKALPNCLIRSLDEDCEADRIRHAEKEREEEEERRRHRKKRKKREREQSSSKRSSRHRDRDRHRRSSSQDSRDASSGGGDSGEEDGGGRSRRRKEKDSEK